LGVDVLFLVPFAEVAQLTAEDFAQKYVIEPFSPKQIVVGYDFAFGKGRQGSIETFRSLVDKNVKLNLVNAFRVKDQVVSTSLIRQNILDGDVQSAKDFLGRAYEVQGTVIQGHKRGRRLGFPTLNLAYHEFQLLPKIGVYAVEVKIQKVIYYGVCNVGHNPTFLQGSTMNVECHILDFDREIYNQPVSIFFLQRLRDEQRFVSQSDLVLQIQKDILGAKAYFLSLPNG